MAAIVLIEREYDVCAAVLAAAAELMMECGVTFHTPPP